MRKLLRKRGVWEHTLVLHMAWLSYSATHVNSRGKVKEAFKGIFSEYIEPQYELCQYRPSRKSAIAKHIELIHRVGNLPNTKSRLYICVLCVERPIPLNWGLTNTWCFTQEKAFQLWAVWKCVYTVALEQHIGTHTRKKTYRCKHCEKLLKKKSAFKINPVKDHHVNMKNMYICENKNKKS